MRMFLKGVLFIVFLIPTSVDAAFVISRSAVSAQGGMSKSPSFRIMTLSGQPAAGLTYSTTGILNAGFLSGSYGCTVNLTDLAIVAEGWLSNTPPFDFDLDTFATLASYWLTECPADWPLK